MIHPRPLAFLLAFLSFAALASAEDIVFPEDSGIIDVVKEFGVKGDGKTDDTDAIEEVIKIGLQPSGNKRLYFRNGTYLISRPLGIFNAKPHSDTRGLTVQGQSEAGTIFKLKDNAPAFQDPKEPGIVWSFYDGVSTGDAMHSYARNFTVDTGKGNPWAAGVRYMTNNVGTMEHVTVRGFDTGVATANTFSLVLEHLDLARQREVAFDNPYGRLTIRDLKSDNSVPALINGKNAELILVGADLTGGAPDATAITLKGGKVFLRDIQQTGYAHLLQQADGTKRDGDTLDEWYGLKGYSLFDAPIKTLRLPIEETPEVEWESDLSKWIKVDTSGGKDVTQSLQKAIDEGVKEGKTTIYFPARSKATITGPIRIHGSINRIVGMNNVIDVKDPDAVFKGDDAPAVFTLEDLDSDTIIVEQFFLLGGWNLPGYITMFENKSGKTVVLRSLGVGGTTKRADPGGRWFIQDVSPSRSSTLQVGKGEHIWARQFNPETYEADMIHVDGGTLWILGLKTEGRTTHVLAENGAKVEVLGGVSYQSWGKQKFDPPMFIVKDSDASFTYGLYQTGTPFKTIVEETRDGVTRTLEAKDVGGFFLSLYRSGGDGGVE